MLKNHHLTRLLILALVAVLLLGMLPIQAAITADDALAAIEEAEEAAKRAGIAHLESLTPGKDYEDGEILFILADTEQTRAMGFRRLYSEDAAPIAEIQELLHIEFDCSRIELLNYSARQEDGIYHPNEKNNNIFFVQLKEISVIKAILSLSDNPLIKVAQPNYIYSGEPTKPTNPNDTPSNILSFTDVKASDWFGYSVSWVCTLKLMNGVSSDRFAPNATLSRAMAATVLYRLAAKPEVEAAASFSDVAAGAWFSDAIAWAQQEKVVEGYAGGTFRPNDSITREQMAVMLYRLAKTLHMDEQMRLEDGADLSSYPDAAQVQPYARQAMQWVVANGIIKGVSADSVSYLRPQGTATRAQFAAVMSRIYQLMRTGEPAI